MISHQSQGGGSRSESSRSHSLHLPFPNALLQIPWPASDRKKSECAFKRKSNEVSRGGDTGALQESPGVPRPSLDDLR